MTSYLLLTVALAAVSSFRAVRGALEPDLRPIIEHHSERLS